MNKKLLDLYADYLISSFGQTTATGLARLLEGAVSHDAITRLLANQGQAFTSRDLWHLVKPLARQIATPEAVLIVDDTVQEKPHTDESELICWHYDHAQGKSVKGLNLLTCLYHSQEVSLPVAFELIRKTELVTDAKTGQPKKRSPQTKNELYRQMLGACCHNRLAFRFVLNDVWFASAENMRYVKGELHKDFVMPLKSNRKVALSLTEQQQNSYGTITSIPLEEHALRQVYLEEVPFPLLLAKQVFTNKHGEQSVLYLVCSDTMLTYEQITALYQRRWKVEEYHKSLKQNAALAKSPAKSVVTQSNHCFAAIYGFIKLERLKLKTQLGHFALRAKLYQQALTIAYQQSQKMASAKPPMPCSA
jgi:hypothetical protein